MLLTKEWRSWEAQRVGWKGFGERGDKMRREDDGEMGDREEGGRKRGGRM